MRATKIDLKFVPVSLVLETQAEVDAIFAVLNHTRLCDLLKLDCSDFQVLDPFKTKQADRLHEAINKALQ